MYVIIFSKYGGSVCKPIQDGMYLPATDTVLGRQVYNNQELVVCTACALTDTQFHCAIEVI